MRAAKVQKTVSTMLTRTEICAISCRQPQKQLKAEKAFSTLKATK